MNLYNGAGENFDGGDRKSVLVDFRATILYLVEKTVCGTKNHRDAEEVELLLVDDKIKKTLSIKYYLKP